MTPSPNPTTAIASQRSRALTVANERRAATAQLKSRLRRRELTLAEVLAHPPTEATFEVLLWAPQFGRQRLRALNPRAVRHGHVEPRHATGRSHRPPAPMAGRRSPAISTDTDLFAVRVVDETNQTSSSRGGVR